MRIGVLPKSGYPDWKMFGINVVPHPSDTAVQSWCTLMVTWRWTDHILPQIQLADFLGMNAVSKVDSVETTLRYDTFPNTTNGISRVQWMDEESQFIMACRRYGKRYVPRLSGVFTNPAVNGVMTDAQIIAESLWRVRFWNQWADVAYIDVWQECSLRGGWQPTGSADQTPLNPLPDDASVITLLTSIMSAIRADRACNGAILTASIHSNTATSLWTAPSGGINGTGVDLRDVHRYDPPVTDGPAELAAYGVGPPVVVSEQGHQFSSDGSAQATWLTSFDSLQEALVLQTIKTGSMVWAGFKQLAGTDFGIQQDNVSSPRPLATAALAPYSRTKVTAGNGIWTPGNNLHLRS